MSLKLLTNPRFLLCNYFWLTTFTSVIYICTSIGWLSTLFLPLILFLCLLKGSKVKINVFDFLWFLLLFWIILTWTFNDYPNKYILILRCLITEITYMIGYWITRCQDYDYISSIISNSYIPLVLTCLIGLYCFYFLPRWYVNMIEKTMEEVGTTNVLEAFRLRSIFWSPYTLAYFNVITLIYEYFYIMKHKSEKLWRHYILIGLLLIVSLLCMMRAPFLCIFIGFCISMLWGYKYISKQRVLRIVMIVAFTSSVVITYMISKIDSYSSDYLLSKITSVTDSSDDFVENRFYQNKTQKSFYLMGDGCGRYNMYADKYNPETSKRDGEYIKMLSELGYIGISIFILMVIWAVFKCLIYFRYLSFEFCIIIMLLICMIGANPLSAGDKHCFIFWMVIGQISKYKPLKKLSCRIR